MAEGLLDRLSDVARDFTEALVLGCPDDLLVSALAARGLSVTAADPSVENAQRFGGVTVQEDRPAFPPGRFDLILACGTLDSVNDLPGALILLRRALRPDGLFLATFVGAGVAAIGAAYSAAISRSASAVPHEYSSPTLKAP